MTRPDTGDRLGRRAYLRSAGAGVAGATILGAASDPVSGQSELSVTFEDQASDGTSVVVTELVAPVEALLILRNEEQETVGGHPQGGAFRFGPDETREDVTVELDEPLSESADLTVSLGASDGVEAVRDSALISLDGSPPDRVGGFGPTLVEADSEAGFNYPYFLYAPAVESGADPKPVLVEPNNTGTPTDDFGMHAEQAETLADQGLGRAICERLDAPLVVPVFPRPRSDPVDGTHYVHALDDTTMEIADGPLERVDLQLLAMVEDAQERLRNRDFPVDDGLLLNGFSASGNFVDRFAVLHPDRVQSVTAGGLNGMALLPLEEADGRTLDFHVGIANAASLTGEQVDLAALDEVDQFLYMGSEDSNDTIPYDDAWTDEGLRETALAVYGEDMVTERFPRCQAAYREAGVAAQFHIYEGEGHNPHAAFEDLVAFHRASLDDEDVSDFGQDLVAVPAFEAVPETPTAGEQVEFDASGSRDGIDEISRYLWEFGTGETAIGETVTHTFAEQGEYTVTLTLVHASGKETDVSETTSVSQAAETTSVSQAAETPTATDSATSQPTSEAGTTADSTAAEDDEPDESTAEDGPGFGVGTAVASILSAGYALKRRGTFED